MPCARTRPNALGAQVDQMLQNQGGVFGRNGISAVLFEKIGVPQKIGAVGFERGP